MKKKVKLKELEGRKWKVSKGDRPSLNSSIAAVRSGEAADAMAKIAETNTELIGKMAAATESLVKALEKITPPTKAVENKPIKVILPDRQEARKNFRFTIVRNNEGFIDYVDVRQL